MRSLFNMLISLTISALCFFSSTQPSISGENISTSEKQAKRLLTSECTQKIRELSLQAKNGDPIAQYEFGRLYDFGWCVKQDGLKAIAWYEKAAKQGHVDAQVSLGNLYGGASSKYLENTDKAFYWYLKAAENGNSFSQAMIGEAYETGDAIPRNYLTAAIWYKRSIEGGFFLAPYFLAKLYASGKVLKKDLIQAYAWNSLSASTGNLMSLNFQNELESKMTREEINAAQKFAASLFEKYGERLNN